MRKFLFVLGLCILMTYASGSARAQYDPHCYFPKIGEPGVIDTIYGGQNQQKLSIDFSLPPSPGSPNGRVMFSGLPDNIPFLSVVSVGPTLDLHHLPVEQRSNLPYLGHARKLHLHSSHLVDLLEYEASKGPPIIYWSDEEGYYDTARSTRLRMRRDTVYVAQEGMLPYCANLSQDSVDDLIFGMSPLPDLGLVLDSVTMFYFRGGPELFSQGRTAYADSAIAFRPYLSNPDRYPVQGNYRGTGRDDLIAGDNFGNLFFYRNDPPFSLARFKQAMLYDTLFARWQNPRKKIYDSTHDYTAGQYALRAFSKLGAPAATDWVLGVALKTNNLDSGGFYFYRGGPTFGEHRLTYDSVSFLMHSPAHYGSGINWGGGFYECGDMTGTGNPVVLEPCISLDGTYGSNYFYVFGSALDDKIDGEFDFSRDPFIDNVDTLTADGDTRMDIVIGMHTFTTEQDNAKGWDQVGSVEVVHGSAKIPRSLVPGRVSRVAGEDMTVYPNPIHEATTITLLTQFSATHGVVIVRDVLGREVLRRSIQLNISNRSVSLRLAELPSGSYQLAIEFDGRRLTKQIVILR